MSQPMNLSTKPLSYKERSHLAPNPIAKTLFRLIDEKRSNLCLSADVTSAEELLSLASLLGPEICVLKTHIDIITDFTPALTKELKLIARKHEFLLFEDRKFADIGATVEKQFSQGIYKISEWADIINAHLLPGPALIDGLKKVASNQALLLVAEMSSKGNLITDAYTEETLRQATLHDDFVIGFISQKKLHPDPAWIHMTPGVQIATTSDHLGQQYHTPLMAIQKGSDVLIVGRGIYGASDPLLTARHYKQQGWQAYTSLMIS